MKTNLKNIAVLLALCVLAVNARAYIILQDNFSYAGGGLLSVAPGVWVPGYGNTESDQVTATGSGNLTIPGTSTTDQPRTYFTNGLVYETLANYGTNSSGQPSTIYITNTSAAYFTSNDPVGAVYASFTVNLPGSSAIGNTYFAGFTDTNYDYRCRISIATNGAAAGNFRIGVGNSGTPTNFVQTDLFPGTTYTVVMRYILSSGISTVWVNPANETTNNTAVSATATGSVNIGGVSAGVNSATCAVFLRNAAGFLNLSLGSLVVGTTFADVVPSSAGSNPPFILQQPQDDINGITNDNVTFSTLAAGDQPLSYQWFSITNGVTTLITGATGSNLVLNAVITNQTGRYYAAITNAAGSNSTRQAQLIIYPAPVAVVISNQPANLTVNVGDTATFTVVAGGVPPPTYQWYYITNLNTTFKTNAIAGATFATLTLTNLNTNSFTTNLMVTVANRVNTNNSIPATLTVSPIQTLTLAQAHAMANGANDGSYNPTNTTSVYTFTGIVTTWTNLTTAGNSEFCIQDATAGIVVFWSGAPSSTNLPPAGAMVKVTGSLNSFNGLLELEPVFSNPLHKVIVLSTNNPLPAAQPLPMDPSISKAQLGAMQGAYFVASNVTLFAGATFAANANEPITANVSNTLTSTLFNVTFTNLQGETFTTFYNSHTDIPGKAKPVGPVTIYGVLSYFTGTGFEFTPTRFADIIAYVHFTNVLSNLTRPGDAATNNYTENFLLPGGTFSSHVSIGDPAGGSVTLTPQSSLPASASWSNITSGNIGTAVFTFKPVMADSGSNYTVSLGVTSTAGSSFTNSLTMYVPATNEQQMAITEILANPTTNTSAPNFNPLQRTVDTIGILTNDEYVEIVNLSDADLTPGWTLDNGNRLIYLFDSRAGMSGTTISATNSLIIYGGIGSGSPGIATPNTVSPNGMQFPSTSSGLLVLRNASGNIIDRLVYVPTDLNTNGSLTRFPTVNGPFVPQAYVSTNVNTPGVQYDGTPWGQPSQIPAGVGGIQTGKNGTNVVLTFTATTGQASTLWNASSVTGPYKVIYGKGFANSAGVFTNGMSGPQQFYYITTQTNY